MKGPLSFLHGAAPTSMPLSSKEGSLIPCPCFRGPSMQGQDKGEKGPSMAVNGQGYKEPSFEGLERGRGHPPWSGARGLAMEGPLSPLLVPSMACPLFPLYARCSPTALTPQRGDTYPPDHSPSWGVPPPCIVPPWRVLCSHFMEGAPSLLPSPPWKVPCPLPCPFPTP